MKKELISVIVPVYNVEEILPYSLQSIINQKFDNLEIIVINDGSTDGSQKICDEYAKKDRRIKVINQKNQGLSVARNVGIEEAKGEYIGFIDSDDIISNEFFEYLYTLIIDTKSDIAECGFSKIQEKDAIEGKYEFDDNEKYIITDSLGALHRLHNEDVHTTVKSVVVWNKLYKKSLFNDIRFPKGKRYEDDFTTYKIFMKINKMISTERILYNYVQREKSIMHQKFSIKRLDALEVFDNYTEAFKNHENQYLFDKCVIRQLRVITTILRELYDSDYEDKTEIENILKKRFEENVKILEEHLENLDEEEKKFIVNSIKKYSKEFYETLHQI